MGGMCMNDDLARELVVAVQNIHPRLKEITQELRQMKEDMRQMKNR